MKNIFVATLIAIAAVSAHAQQEGHSASTAEDTSITYQTPCETISDTEGLKRILKIEKKISEQREYYYGIAANEGTRQAALRFYMQLDELQKLNYKCHLVIMDYLEATTK